ncbi:MAG: hypothetical protein RLQ12_21890 [Cyclobacteriaceae bacterium]
MRYVLKKQHQANFDEDAQKIASLSGIEILEVFVPTAILIESPEETVPELKLLFPDWVIEREIKYKKPGIGPKKND